MANSIQSQFDSNGSNLAAGATGYSTPSTSQLGEQTQAYQQPVNRYQNNLPAGSSL